MANSKKFNFQVVEKRNGWSAEIIRQVSARRTTVSKRETGFDTEALAIEWAEKELAQFVQHQAERNVRKGEQRKEREAAVEAKIAAAEQRAAERNLESDDDEE